MVEPKTSYGKISGRFLDPGKSKAIQLKYELDEPTVRINRKEAINEIQESLQTERFLLRNWTIKENSNEDSVSILSPVEEDQSSDAASSNQNILERRLSELQKNVNIESTSTGNDILD